MLVAALVAEVLLDPGVLVGLEGGGAFVGVLVQQLLHEFHALLGDGLEGGALEGGLQLEDVLHDFGLAVAVEGRPVADHHVEDHPCRPQVALLPVLLQ